MGKSPGGTRHYADICFSSSPEQEIKWRLSATPAFIGEVALKLYRVILLDSLEFVSIAGIHFDPRSHGGRKGNALNVLTLRT